MQDLQLRDFSPRTRLVTAQHHIPRAKYAATDLHTHFGKSFLGDEYMTAYDASEEAKRIREYNVRRVVNLDGYYGETLDNMLRKAENCDDFYLVFGGVDVTRAAEPGFEQYAAGAIRDGVRKGMRGLKFFKEFGLRNVDSNGRLVSPDQKRFECIWQTAAELNIPVLIHIADPIAFFDPIDRRNERFEELSAHPEWSFYGDSFPEFEDMMGVQNRLIAANPDTQFVVAHVGSCAENLARVADFLDRFPNMSIDIAARIAELGRQPYTARKFITKYQDRILYGTDYGAGYTLWPNDFRFLETFDEYFRYDDAPTPLQGRWNVCGLGLDDEVLKKLYQTNAEKLLGD